MSHTIFTVNILRRENDLVNTIWLRHPLREWHPGSTYKKLKKRNAAFRVEVDRLLISQEHTDLFKVYRAHQFLDTDADLRQSLFGPAASSPFDSWMINCYDGDKLVAAGVFDRGEKAAAGIVSFYDPQYENFSLGKYLIYLKMLFCKEEGLEFYYPGYIMTGTPNFDYKHSIGGTATEFFQLSTGSWLPWKEFTSAEWHLEYMVLQLESSLAVLKERGIHARLVYYQLFDYSFYSPFAGKLWDCPVYLHLGAVEGQDKELIAMFDIKKNKFLIFSTELTFEKDYQEIDNKWYCFALLWFEKVQELDSLI